MNVDSRLHSSTPRLIGYTSLRGQARTKAVQAAEDCLHCAVGRFGHVQLASGSVPLVSLPFLCCVGGRPPKPPGESTERAGVGASASGFELHSRLLDTWSSYASEDELYRSPQRKLGLESTWSFCLPTECCRGDGTGACSGVPAMRTDCLTDR